MELSRKFGFREKTLNCVMIALGFYYASFNSPMILSENQKLHAENPYLSEQEPANPIDLGELIKKAYNESRVIKVKRDERPYPNIDVG